MSDILVSPVRNSGSYMTYLSNTGKYVGTDFRQKQTNKKQNYNEENIVGSYLVTTYFVLNGIFKLII